MDPISAVASVIAIYQLASTVSGLCFHYGQGVRRADRDADLVINEIDTFQKYLRTLKEILAKEDVATDGADRLRNLSEIVNGESAALETCRRNLEDMKTKLVKVQSEGRFKEAIHKLSWPLKQEEVSKTLNTLKKFTEAVDRALNVDNNEVIRGIDSTIKRIQGSLESAESQKKREKESLQLSQEQQKADEIKDKILDWLSHPDPSEIHEIARRDRNDRAKTGRWFLNGSAFQEFKATPRSVLWLHGDSGCGKSVLCSSIIDDILAVGSGDSRTELIYWYFSATDKKRTNVDNLLRALVAQLVLKYPIPPFLLDLWNHRKMGREAPKMADLVQTIQKILIAEPSHTYFVVIDALDESDETERAELMRLVRSLALLEADIHILVSSRTNTNGVEKGMKDLTGFYNIAIKGQNADLDILAHVTERLENDDTLAKWSPEVRQTIKDTLIKDAGGMFRWVECQLQAIRKCRKPAEVRKTLNTLPKNLHEVYARDLAKVDESASQDVLRLLEWLAFPQQKLRIEEAVDMLAVDMESNPPAFDEENRMIDSEEVLKMCGSLVRLDRNAEGQNEIGDAGKVQTLTAAHTSVIDFLKTQPIKIGPEEVFKLSRSKANIRMAETCLIYLRYFPENDITLTEDNIASYPFAQLCARNWDDFYREVLASSERVDMARLNGLVMELFSSPTATLNWVKLSKRDKFTERVDFDVKMFHVKPALYYASCLGLPEVVKILIQEGNPIDDVVGPPCGTPLVAACTSGEKDVALLLLDSGADPNLSGYFYYGTPLAAAIEFGGLEIVRFLLGREGVDINGQRHPPLEATEKVFESLEEYRILDRRAEKDENEYKMTKSRCLEIGTQLIELAKNAKTGDWGNKNFRERYAPINMIGAGVEQQPNHFTQSTDTQDKEKNDCAISDDLDETHYQHFLICATAASNRIACSTESMVYIAASRDTLEILETLLAAGADPNIRGGELGTALQMACTRDDDEVVRTLLKNGARTDVYGGFYGSSLSAACYFGSIRIVEHLLKAGADVNWHDARFSSPLFCASGYERADVVKLLLDAGSNVNQKGDLDSTALYLACSYRNKKMVQLLLAHGANPNIQQCGTRDHALQIACEDGDEEIVSLLLESGAKTDLYGGYFDNALQAACVAGNESITRMLLSHGADATRKGGICDNSMLAAVDGGKEIIVDILLDCGVSINEKGGKNTYPLLRALNLFAHDNQDSYVHHLLARGADPNLEREDTQEMVEARNTVRTALQYARSTSLTAMLLDHGAQINTVIGGCKTALLEAILRKSDRVVKLLIDRGADVNLSVWNFGSPLVTACTKGRLEVAKLLVEAGADLHVANLVGHSALLTAILSYKPQLEVFDYLIRLGVDPLQRDNRGCNGLHYAARAKKSDVIKRMLEYGIDINETDLNGWSPLHWAIASTEDSTDIVRLLLQYGCEKSMGDKQGRTALDLAILFEKTEETAILDGTPQAYIKSSEDEESRGQSTGYIFCDGCEVGRQNCKPESWHRCIVCDDFDFCFRCILDKDIIHVKDHAFSNEPA